MLDLMYSTPNETHPLAILWNKRLDTQGCVLIFRNADNKAAPDKNQTVNLHE